MNQEHNCNFSHIIQECLLGKLSKSYDESEEHDEYNIREINLEKYIPRLRDIIKRLSFKSKDPLILDAISSLLILYMELLSKGEWNNNTKIRGYAKLLDCEFQKSFQTTLGNLLHCQTYFNTQEIFDLCLEKLHSQLNLQDFKKLPVLIEVYCTLIQDIEKYKVKISPSKTLPICLLLIDDYIFVNKTKGLTCCLKILQNLSPDDFENTNYHEVVYQSFNNLLHEKNLTNTKLLLSCLMVYFNVLPAAAKVDKTENIYKKVLCELQMETNFERKAAFLEFIPKLIALLGVECVKEKKKFNSVITENLDLCANETIRKSLLGHVLQSLKTWIQYCWCAWNYKTDWKVLSVLLKIHCVIKKEDELMEEVQNIIVTLIYLSAEDDKEIIMSSLKEFSCKNEEITKSLRSM